jgi:cytochrome b6-f complex iron-sulfur subunit
MRRRKRRVDDLVEGILGGAPTPAGDLADPDDAEVLRAAIELRAARPGADLPSEEFLVQLRRRIQHETRTTETTPAARPALSRRLLLAAGSGAVAAGVAGALADRAVLHGSDGPDQPPVAGPASRTLVPNQGTWEQVASTADLTPGQAHRFATPRVIGFVSEHQGELVAVSGACTHLGCLLQANNEAGRLDCPCHRTAFGLDGSVAFSQLDTQPAHLPTIQVRRRGEAIEALLPPED